MKRRSSSTATVTTAAVSSATPDARDASLRRQLLAHRRELETKIRETLSSSRSERPAQRFADGIDEAEASDAEVQDEIAFALLEAHAEAITRIDEAVRRLDDGRYGRCGQCGDDIGELRLRALPFATRCVDCERQREGGRPHATAPAPRSGAYGSQPPANRPPLD